MNQILLNKFLYKLKNDGGAADNQSCNAEYITGYAKVGSAEKNGTRLYVTLEGGDLPITKCREYVFSRTRLGAEQLPDAAPIVG